MARLWLALLFAAGRVGPANDDGAEPSADGSMDGEPILVDCDAISDRPGDGQTFYEDNPTYIDEREPPRWRLSSPSDVGIDDAALEAGADELARSPALLSLLV